MLHAGYDTTLVDCGTHSLVEVVQCYLPVVARCYFAEQRSYAVVQSYLPAVVRGYVAEQRYLQGTILHWSIVARHS